ncbi:MAG: tetratricopeptide repeat protein, partial [Flavobacteriales bacterium]
MDKWQSELDRHAPLDATHVRLLTDLAEAYMSVEPVKADTLLDDAIGLARRISAEKELGRALALQGELIVIRYLDPALGARSVQEAEQVHRKLDDRIDLAVDLALLANLEFDEKGATAAADRLREADRLLVAFSDTRAHGSVLAAYATHALNMDLADSALRCSERARALFHSAGDRARENRMTAQSGSAHIAAGRNNLALPLLTEAMIADSIAGCWYRQGIELSMSGNVNADMGNNATAVELYMRAARTFERIDDLSGEAAVLNNAAIVYFNIGMHAEAASTYTEALDKALRSGNDRWASNILMNLGEVYVARGDHDLALEYTRKSMALNGGRFPEALASMHEIMSKAYLGKGQQDSAIIHLRIAIAANGGSDEVSLQARCMIALARVLRHASPAVLRSAAVDPALRDDLVSNALDSALAVGRSAPLLEVQRDALYELALIAEQRGNAAEALRYFKLSSALKDSLVSGEKVKAVADVRFQYDTEKREQGVALDKAVQAKEIQKQKLVRNGFIGAFVLVALFAGVFMIQRNRISKERARSEELLLNILPEEVAEELKAKGHADAKHFDSATILFT